MGKSSIYVGLEIGTTKICVVVGEVRGDGAIKILGVGEAPSRGVRKGEIVDFDTAQTCLHDALVRAEDRSDVMIRNVYLSMTGSHIESLNNRGCIRVPEDQNEVTYDDLEEAKEIARDVPVPHDNAFLHSIIRHYYVDGGEKVLNPVGMLGTKLEADYHIIHGMRSRIQNSIRCVREIPLEVEDIVFSPIAAAQVLLSRDNKEQGALVIDMGGGTTDFVLYSEGSIAQSGAVGIGGDHITNDISIVMKIPIKKAEELKVKEATAYLLDETEAEPIELPDDTSFTGKVIDRALLNEVVHMRVREIFEHIRRSLEEGGDVGRVASGVFLSGGCSLIGGVREIAEEILELPVQRPDAAPMSGLNATFENPRYAVPIGLIRYAQILADERPVLSPLARLGSKLTDFFGGSRSGV